MTSLKRLQKQFNAVQDVRQPVRQKFHALLGHPDGTTIEDPETAGFVFVRIDGDSNRVRRALCREVLQRYNQKVIVAYSDELPNTLEVIKLDKDAFPPAADGGSSWDGGAQLGRHATQHEMFGGDTIWIQTKQIVPLRTKPLPTPNMHVYVEPGAYQYATGFNYWPGGYSDLLTNYVPTGALNTQRFRLIYIDPATNTLSGASTTITSDDELFSHVEEILDLIPISCVPLAAIRLVFGQSTVQEADIFDLRSFVSSAPGTVVGANPQGLIVVAKAGGTYTTIWAGNNAATAGYVVWIMPGAYSEVPIEVTPGVTIQGVEEGYQRISTTPLTLKDASALYNMIIAGSAIDEVALATHVTASSSIVDNCLIQSPLSADVIVSAGGQLTLRECRVEGRIHINNGILILEDCEVTAGGILQDAGAGDITISGGQIAGNITHVLGATIILHNLPTLTGTISGGGTVVGAYKDANGVVKFLNGATAASGSFFDALTDGATGGFRAGAASDVLWRRHATTADVWVTPDSVEIDGRLSIGAGVPLTTVGLYGEFIGASAVAPLYAMFYDLIVNGTTATAIAVRAQVVTTDTVFTLGEATGVFVDTPEKGAASIITIAYGLKVADQNVAGTNYAIYTGLGAVRFGDAVTATILNLTATANQIVMQSAGVTGTLTWTPATSNKVVTFPNATGTVALLPVANVFTALQTVSANAATLPTATTGTLLHLGQADSSVTRFLMDGFAVQPQHVIRRANGTAASPSALAANNVIGSWGVIGYHSGPGYSNVMSRMDMLAAEAWTNAAQGTYVAFYTTPIGSTTIAEVLRIDNVGNVGIGVTAFGTSAAKVLGIGLGTVPSTSPANMIQLYAKDSSAGSANATLAIRTEQAVAAIGTFTASHKLRVWVNEVEYDIQLDAV